MIATGRSSLNMPHQILEMGSIFLAFDWFQRFKFSRSQATFSLFILSLIIICKQEFVWLSLAVLFSMALIILAVKYWRELHVMECFYLQEVQEKQLDAIYQQKQFSDNLLQSILPKFIIDRLKVHEENFLSLPVLGGVSTVLVADIVKFTDLLHDLRLRSCSDPERFVFLVR